MTKVEQYTSNAISIADDNSHGYSQANRWGPDYDCSSLVCRVVDDAGIPVRKYGASYTGNMKEAFIKCGFHDVTASCNLANGAGMHRGDILLNIKNHAAIYIGNGRLVHARSSEGNTIQGDQSGNEIRTQSYYNYPWDCILRYIDQQEASSPAPSVVKMKYSESNPPLVCMMRQSTCYNSTAKMNVRGVLWHSTGANNPWIKRYVQPDDTAADRDKLLNLIGKNLYRNDWNHIAMSAGLNAWIGKLEDGTVTTVQTMPWNYIPWGCGSGSKGSCNHGWIQFEICEDGLGDQSYFNAVYQEACQLTAYLCKLYGIDPYGSFNGIPTILCHQDSYQYGMGTNHSDVYHWFNRYGKTMDDVRNDVALIIGGKQLVSSSAKQNNTNPIHPVLRVGSKGDAVAELQTKLNAAGYNAGDVDGEFGTKTLRALRIFQEQCGLEVDGIAGNNTWAVLDKVVDDTKAKETSKQSGGNKAAGISVGDVVKIQRGAEYLTGRQVPDWITNLEWIVQSVTGDRIVINKSVNGRYAINSPIHAKYLICKSDDTTKGVQADIAIGDIVDFSGSVHYLGAMTPAGKPCRGGKARVMNIYKAPAAKHPYLLVAVSGGGSNVHGWVDASDVKKV